MAEVKTGHSDLADVLSQRQQIFDQVVSDLTVLKDNPSPLVSTYTMDEFKKDKRFIIQGRKAMKIDGEASKQEAQRQKGVEMSYTKADYSVRSEFSKKWLRDASSEQIQDEADSLSFAAQELLDIIFFIAVLERPTTSTTSNTTGFYYGQTDAPRYKAKSFTSAHDHYLVTASSTAWAVADLITGRNHITEHGYAETDGGVTFWGDQATMDEMAALTGFTDLGINEEQERNGVVGKLSGVWLRKELWMPANYGIFLPTGQTPVVVHKQHEDPAYRGAIISAGNNPADPLDGSKVEYNAISMNVVLKGAGACMFRGATWANQTTLSVS